LLYNVQENLYNCRQSIRAIQEQRGNYGTSLAQTFLTVRLQQQVERMLIIIDVLDNDHHLIPTALLNTFYNGYQKREYQEQSWRISIPETSA
jgi:site-specific recombinase